MHPVLDQLPKQLNYSAERGLQSFSIGGDRIRLADGQPNSKSQLPEGLMDATKSALWLVSASGRT